MDLQPVGIDSRPESAIPKHGFKVRFDHKFKEYRNPSFVPSLKIIWDLLMLVVRYLLFYVYIRFWKQRKPYMDYISIVHAKQIYGVPIGGIGSGTIGRGFRGEFCRFQIQPGMYEYNTVDANDFIVTVKDGDGVTVLQSLLSGYEKSGKCLQAWQSLIDSSKCNYTGLYPRAWSVYDLSEYGILLECRQVSPVIPKDYRDSSTPAAVFAFTMKNVSEKKLSVSITFTFKDGLSDFSAHNDVHNQFSHDFNTANAQGAVVSFNLKDMACQYAVGALKTDSNSGNISTLTYFDPTSNGEDFWNELDKKGHLRDFPAETATNKDIGIAVSVQCELEPNQTLVDGVKMCLAWHIPQVQFPTGKKTFRKYYTKFFENNEKIGTVEQIASESLRRFGMWEQAIYAWQNPILENVETPDWYKNALFNELYFVSDGGSVWFLPDKNEVNTLPSSDPRLKFGHFGYLEGHEYRMYNTYDVHFYASFALAMLWPNLQLIIQYDIKDAIFTDLPEKRWILFEGGCLARKRKNCVPHDLGDPGENPFETIETYNVHDVSEWRDLNLKFVLQVFRDYRLGVAGDEYVRDMYEACRAVMKHAMTWDRDGDGLIENHGVADQTYDAWVMTGPSAYCGSLWLAALYAMNNMATKLNQMNDATQFQQTLIRAKKSFADRLWNGEFYSFDVNHSNVVMSDQLCGNWYLRCSGAKSDELLPQNNVRKALEVVYQQNVLNFADGEKGAVNGMIKDDTVDYSSLQSQEIWTGVVYSVASAMLFEGMTKEAWKTAGGLFQTLQDSGLVFQTPEAMYEVNHYRSIGYMRPLSIWSMQLALEAKQKGGE